MAPFFVDWAAYRGPVIRQLAAIILILPLREFSFCESNHQHRLFDCSKLKNIVWYAHSMVLEQGDFIVFSGTLYDLAESVAQAEVKRGYLPVGSISMEDNGHIFWTPVDKEDAIHPLAVLLNLQKFNSYWAFKNPNISKQNLITVPTLGGFAIKEVSKDAQKKHIQFSRPAVREINFSLGIIYDKLEDAVNETGRARALPDIDQTEKILRRAGRLLGKR